MGDAGKGIAGVVEGLVNKRRLIMAMVIIPEGMGGFLNPPRDAEHNWSVKTTGQDGNGSMALRYALRQRWVSESLKASIESLLAANPPQLTETWVRDCYAYFKNCYSPDGLERDTTKMVVDAANSRPPEHHLAHLHIRQFFPDYAPRIDLIANPPEWGKES